MCASSADKGEAELLDPAHPSGEFLSHYSGSITTIQSSLARFGMIDIKTPDRLSQSADDWPLYTLSILTNAIWAAAAINEGL